MNIKVVVSFVVGAAMGASAAYMATRAHYRKIADEEIKSVKEMYKEEKQKMTEKVSVEPEEKEETEETEESEESEETVIVSWDTKEKVNEMIKSYGHIEKYESDEPHVISEEEFFDNEDDGYRSYEYYLFEDGVVSDDMGDRIERPEDVFGKDWEDGYERFDLDICYVVDPPVKTQYQILKDPRTYSEMFYSE